MELVDDKEGSTGVDPATRPIAGKRVSSAIPDSHEEPKRQGTFSSTSDT